jgi:uncharacterized cupin superfamily protein
MSIVIQNVNEMEYYQGDHAIAGIKFRPARQAMGVTSWGMNVLQIDPMCAGHPEHDHRHDGQEEVYLVVTGAAVLIADGREHPLKTGDMVRVPPETVRKFVTRADGATILALGGIPGTAYSPDPRMG